MPGILMSIPLSRWVHGTIQKMNSSGKRDIHNWGEYWLETYTELGGKSFESGSKGCPQHAAYGLWRLGRIKGGNIPYQKATIESIIDNYGRNAAYAVIALGLLEEGKTTLSQKDFWLQVRERFKRMIHEEPAVSEQGQVRLARILFEEGYIVSN